MLIEKCNQVEKEERRDYLGVSLLSSACGYYRWATYNWVYSTEIEPRLRRVFDLGHMIEEYLIENLPISQMQMEVTFPGYPFIEGHIDGVYTDENNKQYLVEIKTANDASFKETVKNGINRNHLIQMNLYMHGLGLDSGIYIVYNKNTSELEESAVSYDEGAAILLLEQAKEMLENNETPQPKCHFNSPTFYKCRMCTLHKHCQLREGSIDKNCRTCKNSYLDMDNGWICRSYNSRIPREFQLTGCDKYIPKYEIKTLPN